MFPSVVFPIVVSLPVSVPLPSPEPLLPGSLLPEPVSPEAPLVVEAGELVSSPLVAVSEVKVLSTVALPVVSVPAVSVVAVLLGGALLGGVLPGGVLLGDPTGGEAPGAAAGAELPGFPFAAVPPAMGADPPVPSGNRDPEPATGVSPPGPTPDPSSEAQAKDRHNNEAQVVNAAGRATKQDMAAAYLARRLSARVVCGRRDISSARAGCQCPGISSARAIRAGAATGAITSPRGPSNEHDGVRTKPIGIPVAPFGTAMMSSMGSALCRYWLDRERRRDTALAAAVPFSCAALVRARSLFRRQPTTKIPSQLTVRSRSLRTRVILVSWRCPAWGSPRSHLRRSPS